MKQIANQEIKDYVSITIKINKKFSPITKKKGDISRVSDFIEHLIEGNTDNITNRTTQSDSKSNYNNNNIISLKRAGK